MSGFVAKVERVIDADTVVVVAQLLPLLGVVGEVHHRVRLIGINAPELNTVDGVAAAQWLEQLAAGKECLVAIYRFDKYGGRVIADVWLAGDSVTLSDHALATGHAVPYGGGKP